MLETTTFAKIYCVNHYESRALTLLVTTVGDYRTISPYEGNASIGRKVI